MRGDDSRRSAGIDDVRSRLRLMEAVVRDGMDAVVVTELDDDGQPSIVFVNDAFTAQTGWSRDEVVGDHPRVLVGPETSLEAQLELRRAVEQQESTTVELVHYRRDGSTFTVENVMLPVVDGDGRCTHIVSFQRDISARIQSERALRESEERFRLLAEHASDVITVLDRDGRIRYTSPSVEWLLGHPLGLYSSMFELIHPDDQPRVAQIFAERLSQPGLAPPVELRLAHADGTWREVEALSKNLLDDPMVEGMVVTIRDITDRKRAERVLAGQARVLELLLAGRPVSESLEAVALLVEEQVPGTRCAVLLHDLGDGRLTVGAAPSLPPAYVEAVDALDTGGSSACLAAVRDAVPIIVSDVELDPAGQLARVAGSRSCWAVPVLDGSGSPVAVVVAYHDRPHEPTPGDWQVLGHVAGIVAVVIERQRAAAELAHRATHDPVTELPNRSLVLDRMRLSLARLQRRQRSLAVLAITVDRLERVADSMGHEAAGEVLMTVAGRLSQSLRPEDTVGDLGGGLFVVVADIGEEVRSAVAVADTVARAVAAPHVLAQGPVFLTGSIGIALATAATDNPDVLLDDAVAAMRRAAESGGGRYELFDAALRDRVVDRMRVENGLHRALQRAELILHYQPVIRLADGMPVSVEALVRWVDPERGIIPPAQFIPVAEDTGLIDAIGAWALETACRQLAAWKHDGIVDPGFSVAVNVSPRQLHDGLVETIVGSIGAHGLRRGELSIEVTESTLMSDLDAGLDVLHRVRAAGVSIAIDDFGTGHSSLALLRQLPVDVLKIDRSFVSELDDPDGSPIPAIVANLAHGLGLTAVAEGVETPAQAAALLELGCDRSQGFLHCPPLPEDEVARWLRRTSVRRGLDV